MKKETPEQFDRYSRQVLLPDIGVEGQERLRDARALVLGVGALGTTLASNMVRAGVGYVRLVDRDYIELHNLQRQTLFDEEDVAEDLPKAVAAARKLRRINSQVTIDPIVGDVTHTHIERLMGDCDVVLDGSDNFEVRMILNDACLKHGVPWIYGAVMATYGVTMPILPNDGPCLRCLIGSVPQPGSMPTCDTVGVLGTVPQVVAAMQTTEALKLLTGHRDQLCRDLRYIDLWTGEMSSLTVTKPSDAPCPACEGGRYEYLDGKYASVSDRLCGREAVQIRPRHTVNPDFDALADRLASLGQVSYNEYLLRFTKPPHEIVLFSNGRAIIHGVTEPGVARALYAQYVGQ